MAKQKKKKNTPHKVISFSFRNTSTNPKNLSSRSSFIGGAEKVFHVLGKKNEEPLTDEFCTELKKSKSGRLIKMLDRLIF